MRVRAWLFVGVALLGPACFYDWDLPESDAGPPPGDAAGDATVDVADAGADTPPLPDGPIPPPDVREDAPPSKCFANGSNCSPVSYCDVPPDQCASGALSGVCTPLPNCSANLGYTKYCTCNGVFDAECDALLKGGGYRTSGCQPEPGFYQCGYVYCASKTLCVYYPANDTYECVAAPGCSTGTVDCQCAKDGCDGGPTVGQCQPIDGGAMFVCK